FNATPTSDIYTLSLHDALPILGNEEENDGGLREHEIGILDGRAHQTRDHERRRDRALDQQADVWRLPARMDPPERRRQGAIDARSEEHTSELQSRENLVCRLLL